MLLDPGAVALPDAGCVKGTMGKESCMENERRRLAKRIAIRLAFFEPLEEGGEIVFLKESP